ncbi:hypothetical protein BDZ91DRAFT_733936 [Kalaharituber pfeilii]|nr:hypothetical protein BDZ91DRAFT_733936 [Kalaharituber pfeilii]
MSVLLPSSVPFILVRVGIGSGGGGGLGGQGGVMGFLVVSGEGLGLCVVVAVSTGGVEAIFFASSSLSWRLIAYWSLGDCTFLLRFLFCRGGGGGKGVAGTRYSPQEGPTVGKVRKWLEAANKELGKTTGIRWLRKKQTLVHEGKKPAQQ